MVKEIFNTGGIVVKKDEKIAEIYCYGCIGRWCDIDDRAFIAVMAECDGLPINVHINSEGGEVTTAIAIKSLLEKHNAQVTIFIDGLAASAATLITCAKNAKVIAVSGALLMVHSPLFDPGLSNADDLRKVIQSLDECKSSILSIYHEKTKLDKKQLIALMESETFMTAKTALKLGFIDAIDMAVYAKNALKAHKRILGYDRHKYLMEAQMNEQEQEEVQEQEKSQEEQPQEQEQSQEEEQTQEQEQEQSQEEEQTQENEKKEAIPNEEIQAKWMALGAKKERDRIKALEELAPKGCEKLLFDAKYTQPVDASQFAINLVKAQKEHGANFLMHRESDAQSVNNLETKTKTVTSLKFNADMDKNFFDLVKKTFKNK